MLSIELENKLLEKVELLNKKGNKFHVYIFSKIHRDNSDIATEKK